MSRSTISTFQLFERFPDQEAARVYLGSEGKVNVKLSEVVSEARELAEGRRDWTEAFENAMRDMGAVYVPDSPCTCHNGGERGHAAECGWTLEGGAR